MPQVQRLQGLVRDRRAAWQQSLSALQLAKDSGARLTKSSIMLGCGEQPHEVLATFKALRDHGEFTSSSATWQRPHWTPFFLLRVSEGRFQAGRGVWLQ